MKSWEWDEYTKKVGRYPGLIAGSKEDFIVEYDEGFSIGREEGLAAGREEGIYALIRSCRKYNTTDDEIINELMSNFSIAWEEAQGYLNQSSKQS